MPEIHRFRMLVVGSQLPYHEGYDISPDRAQKWVQRGHTSGRDAISLPTIVGECGPLPPDEWDRFAHGVAISGILELEGNPNYAVLHGATWYFDVDLGDSHKCFKAYGISAMEVLKGEEWEDMGFGPPAWRHQKLTTSTYGFLGKSASRSAVSTITPRPWRTLPRSRVTGTRSSSSRSLSGDLEHGS